MAVNIGWMTRKDGFKYQWGRRIFSTVSRSPLGPIWPPIQWASSALSPGVKKTEYEADHCIVLRLRICGTILILPLYVLMV